MTYMQLLLGFLKVGCFAFGGAYGAIPLIRDVVTSYGWMDEARFSYLIAVSESTPGPIMVNMATYVGSQQGGLAGALLATTGVVLPSFFIILLICAALRSALRNPALQAALSGVKPCIVGVVIATGLVMIGKTCFGAGAAQGGGLRAIALTAALLALCARSLYVKKKPFNPIHLIVISALAGCMLYAF